METETIVVYGGEVKALGDGKVGGYLVRFTSATDPDLAGDYFTKDTDFGEYKNAPVLFQHGMDETIGLRTLGSVTLKMDEVGLWAEGILMLRDAYEKAIYELAKKGKLGWSSGTASHLVRRKSVGEATEILAWPIGLDASLTPTPAEPRNTAMSLKSYKVENIIGATEGDLEVPAKSKGEIEMEETKETKPVEESKATPDRFLEKFNEAVKAQRAAEAKAAEDDKKFAEAVKAALELSRSEQKSAPAHPLDSGAPSFNQKTGRGDSEMKAFWYWMRTGDKGAYKADVILNEADDEQGGATVPADFYARIVEKRDEISVARLAGATVLQTSLKTVNIPVEGVREDALVLTAESAGATSVSYNMNAVEPVDTKTVTLYKYTRMHKLSEELLNDNKANIEDFLVRRVGRQFGVQENAIFHTGTGSGQPEGAVVGGGQGKLVASASTVTAAEIMSFYYSLTEPYRSGAVWTMRSATQAIIRGLSGNPFSFVITPQGSAGSVGVERLIGDQRVYSTDGIAAIAASAKTILLGNWEYFFIAENGGFTVKRLNERFADTGEVGFLFSQRIGSAVMQAEAFKYLQMASA